VAGGGAAVLRSLNRIHRHAGAHSFEPTQVKD
jgi:hypothetical protein